MLVQDIMHIDVKVARPDTSVRDVAIVMCFNKISGLPVVDENNDIVGVISEKDILKAMYPGVDEYMQSGRLDFESLEDQYRDILSLKVRELMSTKIHTVSPDAPVLKAVSTMCLYKIRRIPVAVKGKLVGIISMGDVHKAIFTQNLEATVGQDAVGTGSRTAVR